jgi:hypothetical protein
LRKGVELLVDDIMTGPTLRDIYGREMPVNRHPNTGQPVAMPF